MSHILLYSRPKAQEPIAEQTVVQLAEQLDLIGHQVDITHSLNIPRLILNTYETIHLVVDHLPLTVNESFHLGLCKALQKNTLVSLLNSDRFLNQLSPIKIVSPDAMSVSQTNHLKYYRGLSAHKFIMPALPLPQQNMRSAAFKLKGHLTPLLNNLEEAIAFNLSEPIFFDGRLLLKNSTASQLRRKWNAMLSRQLISAQSHLILSEGKLNELLEAGHLAVILAQSGISHTDFTTWLNRSLNHKNLIVMNENQSTGFAYHWTSGHNCVVVSGQNWIQSIEPLIQSKNPNCSSFRSTELLDGVVNELSRLYAKLSQQKTTLLTSRSAKL